ncbi:MAG: hypothetical protein IPG96_00695 [Proteobacteria bacterium]|nr:hypothetical protein [Pseudomonadota bacterium]
MPESDLERIFSALQRARVRYLVVGGVAVVLHGHPRFTADLDLVVQLEPDNVLAALEALETLGYRPRPPVPARAFADASQRAAWVRDQGLIVFSLWSPRLPTTEIDLFAEEPFAFDEVYARALHVDLGTTATTIPALADLLVLKRAAGRPRDAEDVRALEAIAAETPDDAA